MRLRPLLHDRLVVRAVFGSLLLVWVVLVAFDAILDFGNQLDDVGKGGYSVSHAVLYIICTIPNRFYELFPTAALIGSLLGLGGLAATSELTALRAAGISRWRICMGAILGLAVATAIMMINGETAAPIGEQAAESIQISAKSDSMMVSKGAGLWARDGNVFIKARAGAKRLNGGENEVDLLEPSLFHFDKDGTLLSMIQAARAEYTRGHWILRGVVRTDYSDASITQTREASETWQSRLKPETVLANVEHPRYESSTELRSNIDYMQRNRVDASEYENAYWARCFYPLNVLAMCLAALPFAFGQLRSGGFGKRLFSGIVCGLTFFLIQRFAQNIATIYHLPLWGAHVAPPILVLAASQWYFRKKA